MPLATVGAALVEAVGAGCLGSNAKAPQMQASGLPVLGNAAFALGVRDARASAPAVMLLANASASLVLGGGCTLYVGGTVANLPATTNASGVATVPVAIPNNLAFVGVELWAQFGIADAGGSYLGAVTISDGTHLLLGK